MLVLLFALNFPTDICDQVNDLANSWQLVSNYIVEHEEDGFTDIEIEALVKMTDDLDEATTGLINVLLELGNPDEVKLGKRLEAAMANLAEAEGIDEVVDGINIVVDRLDDAVDYCDAN